MFNLTQDAEGDATVFDMNGDLIQTNILIGNMLEWDKEKKKYKESTIAGAKIGVFDSIIPKLDYDANPLQIVKQD